MHDSEKKNSKVLVHLDPSLKRIKEMVIEFDFAWLEIQGRSVKGSTLTAHKVDRVVNALKGEDEGVDDSPLEKKIDDQPVKTASDKKKTEEIPEQKAKPSSNKNSTQVAKPDKESGKAQPKEQATFDFKDN